MLQRSDQDTRLPDHHSNWLPFRITFQTDSLQPDHHSNRSPFKRLPFKPITFQTDYHSNQLPFKPITNRSCQIILRLQIQMRSRRGVDVDKPWSSREFNLVNCTIRNESLSVFNYELQNWIQLRNFN